jgi:Rieske Fe-S protein
MPLVYGGALAAGALRYLGCLRGRKPEPRRKLAGTVEEYKAGRVDEVLFNEETIFVLACEDKVVAKKAKCPHLGCNVKQQGEGFFCPCHGMTFRRDGGFIQGPTRKDLTDQKLELGEDGSVTLIYEGDAC